MGWLSLNLIASVRLFHSDAFAPGISEGTKAASEAMGTEQTFEATRERASTQGGTGDRGGTAEWIEENALPC